MQQQIISSFANEQQVPSYSLLTSLYFYKFQTKVAYWFKLENPRIPRFHSQIKIYKSSTAYKL